MGKKRKKQGAGNGNGYMDRESGGQDGAGQQYGGGAQYGVGAQYGGAARYGAGDTPPGFDQGAGAGFGQGAGAEFRQGPGAGFGPGPGAGYGFGFGAPGAGPDAGFLQGMAAFLPRRSTEQFMLGVTIGAAMAWVLSDEELRGKLVKSGMKLYAGVVGGFEEMKEQMADIRAEVEAERNQDP